MNWVSRKQIWCVENSGNYKIQDTVGTTNKGLVLKLFNW